MDARQERGLRIAAICKLRKQGKKWLVPSQSGNGKYEVCPDSEKLHCTCPDHATTGNKCKHIFAVEFVIERERHPDGSVTVTDSVKITERRKTYPQQWSAYNAAQTHEKEKFQQLLHDLCCGIEVQPLPRKRGRPRLCIADVVFNAAYKVYSTFSARRFMCDLRDAHARGYIERLPHYNTIFKYLENSRLTPVLYSLIAQSALPLRAVVVDFAADSSGFTTSRFVRWHDHKYGVVRREHDWVKVHLMCGVKTNIVTAVEIRDRDASDTKLLPDLVKTTAANFKMNEVSGDKGYAGINHTNVVASYGAVPYIAFKENHTGSGGGLCKRCFIIFNSSVKSSCNTTTSGAMSSRLFQ